MQDMCAVCGQKLSRSNLYMAWTVKVTPVKSWCRWNGVMRLFLPVYFGLFLLILLLEAACGGVFAAVALLRGGMPLYFLFFLVLRLPEHGLFCCCRGLRRCISGWTGEASRCAAMCPRGVCAPLFCGE